MPTITDRGQIRAILSTDSAWCAYALGDLSPGFYEHCEWHVPADDNKTLVLLYRGVDPPIFFAHGDVPAVERLVDDMAQLAAVYLHVRPDVVPIFTARYQNCHLDKTWLMALNPAEYQPTPIGQAIRLGIDHLESLRQLYSDGDATGEAPDFFLPSMLAQGVYFGIWEGQQIIAAAGTHLIATEEGVGALGNVYTRRDRRGQGHAAAVTSAVTNELMRMKLPTIVLCVDQRRETAIRLYERLGYIRHCAFWEGVVRNNRPSRPFRPTAP